MPGQPKIRDRPNVFKSFTLSPGFLSGGLTMADLKQSGTIPVVREVFMISVMTGARTSRYCLVRGVVIGSRSQLFEAVVKISFSMLASVTVSKSQMITPVWCEGFCSSPWLQPWGHQCWVACTVCVTLSRSGVFGACCWRRNEEDVTKRFF